MAIELWQMLGLGLAAANFAAFVLMGVDKKRARRSAWRIPERVLFLPAVLGGALGGLAGMRVFHHKTKHRSFALGFPALAIIQIAGLIYLIVHLGVA